MLSREEGELTFTLTSTPSLAPGFPASCEASLLLAPTWYGWSSGSGISLALTVRKLVALKNRTTKGVGQVEQEKLLRGNRTRRSEAEEENERRRKERVAEVRGKGVGGLEEGRRGKAGAGTSGPLFSAS